MVHYDVQLIGGRNASNKIAEMQPVRKTLAATLPVY